MYLMLFLHQLLFKTTAKAKNTLTKLEKDIESNNRLGPTYAILRGCRYWNYKWLANRSLDTMEVEVLHIHRIAGISPHLRQSIILELKKYKKLADLEMTKNIDDQSSL
jgi:hypothetical protein